MSIHKGLRPGVPVVLVTPFLPDEALDEASIPSLVDDRVSAGAEGVLILGVMGEADRLSDAERARTIDLVVDRHAGRMQVTAGVTAGSTMVARASKRRDRARRGRGDGLAAARLARAMRYGSISGGSGMISVLRSSCRITRHRPA